MFEQVLDNVAALGVSMTAEQCAALDAVSTPDPRMLYTLFCPRSAAAIGIRRQPSRTLEKLVPGADVRFRTAGLGSRLTGVGRVASDTSTVAKVPILLKN